MKHLDNTDQLFGPTIAELGREWFDSPLRPRVEPSIAAGWDTLIKEWIASDLPLIVRKGGRGRGAEHIHQATGRIFTYADNTPAAWVMEAAIGHRKVLTLDDIAKRFEQGAMPLAMAFKSSERALVKYTSGGLSKPLWPNAEGWKVCHIKPVSPVSDRKIDLLPINMMHEHFHRFLSPSNMFLIPKKFGGLGEVDLFIAAFRQPETRP